MLTTAPNLPHAGGGGGGGSAATSAAAAGFAGGLIGSDAVNASPPTPQTYSQPVHQLSRMSSSRSGALAGGGSCHAAALAQQQQQQQQQHQQQQQQQQLQPLQSGLASVTSGSGLTGLGLAARGDSFHSDDGFGDPFGRRATFTDVRQVLASMGAKPGHFIAQMVGGWARAGLGACGFGFGGLDG